MSTKSNAKFIYFTVSSMHEAKSFSTMLVSKKFAACANILGASTSIYEWKGKVIEEKEVIVLLKTRDNLVQPVIENIKEMHPYDCPAIAVLNVEDGNEDFLRWINETTMKEV